jgi:hypothetical protein
MDHQNCRSLDYLKFKKKTLIALKESTNPSEPEQSIKTSGSTRAEIIQLT